jgi:Sortilin, neurotensin receptor 3,
MKCLAALIVMFASTQALANGRLPAANQLVVAPDNAQTMLLRTTFGFLFTTDTGTTWNWLCEPAIPCQGQQDPAVALLNGGVVLSGQIEGLATSPDLGCSWSFVQGTSQQQVIDVARTRDGSSAVAIKNVFASTTDAGVLLYDTEVLQTSDTGKTWQPLTGVVDPTLVIDTLDTAPSDPHRVYITGAVYGQDHATMLVSKDGGQSYAPYTIPFITNELGAFIAAVDPNVEDTVYVRTLALDPKLGTQMSRLLVSTDGGQTFTQEWTGDKMLGFALSADGSRVYVGSTLDGLMVASTSDFAFTQTSSHQIQCLTMVGTTLYACGNEAESGFILGSTTNEGASFTPLLKFETIHQPLSCPATSSACQCINEWPAQAEQLGIADASITNNMCVPPKTTPPSSGGCGCEASSPRPRDGLWLLAAAGIYFTLRSRRSRAAR